MNFYEKNHFCIQQQARRKLSKSGEAKCWNLKIGGGGDILQLTIFLFRERNLRKNSTFSKNWGVKIASPCPLCSAGPGQKIKILEFLANFLSFSLRSMNDATQNCMVAKWYSHVLFLITRDYPLLGYFIGVLAHTIIRSGTGMSV